MDETRESLAKLRVVDLKQRLSANGLPVGGLKAELVDRLYQYLVEQFEEQNENEGEEESQEQFNQAEQIPAEEVYHREQQAMIQKQQEESAKQAELLRMQQEAMKQNEDEEKQLQALGLKPSSGEEPPSQLVAPPPHMQQHTMIPQQMMPAPPTTMMQHPPSHQSMMHQQPGPPAQMMQQPGPPAQMMQQPGPPAQMMQQPGPPGQMMQQPVQMMQQSGPPLQMMQQSGPPAPLMQQSGPSMPPQQPSLMDQHISPHDNVMHESRAQRMIEERTQPMPLLQDPPHGLLQDPPNLAHHSQRSDQSRSRPLMPDPPQLEAQMMHQSRGMDREERQMQFDDRSPANRSFDDRNSGSNRSYDDGSSGPLNRRSSDDARNDQRQSMRRTSTENRTSGPPPLMSLDVNAPPEESKTVKLPQALEEVLAFKQERAIRLGVDDQNEEESDKEEQQQVERVESPPREDVQSNGWSANKNQTEKDVESEEDDMEVIQVNEKKDKQRRKKNKKKKNKGGNGNEQWILRQMDEERMKREEDLKKRVKKQLGKEKEKLSSDIDIQYVPEEISLDYSDPMHRYFAKIFEAFKIVEEPTEDELKKEEISELPIPNKDLKKVPKLAEDTFYDSDTEDKDDDSKPKVSKRKLKLSKRMSIAELKQTVSRPDVVEMHDITAKNPKLLVHLKAARNTVPVPRHWCFKRKYLQGKRGIEKPPFELPDFIKRTGIMEMRAALQEKEDQKTLKSKMREKVRPKMGKIDIDYHKLHDAFFKWQSKPEMTLHGDLYYEGKEYETKMKDKKPGEMSDDLRIALGMPVGANAHKVPPPWLIAMQRYGPPPSYPNLKIPGLNAPIPEGCSFGYHAGGWGKPPVDNMGKPIYGDVFGTLNKDSDIPMVEEDVERSLWGEMESESEEESEEEEESEDEEEDNSGLVTPGDTGLVTPSGISSLPAGLETPDMIELRKKQFESEIEGGDTPALYHILPEKRNENIGRAMMGSNHTYDIPSTRPANQGVEVALDPSELDLADTDAMAARYEATLREQNAGDDEDFSDMVAEHAAKQRNKRKRLQQQEQNKPAKKYKDFKF